MGAYSNLWKGKYSYRSAAKYLKIQKNKLPDWIGSERDEEGRARRSSFARTMAGPVVGDVGSE